MQTGEGRPKSEPQGAQGFSQGAQGISYSLRALRILCVIAFSPKILPYKTYKTYKNTLQNPYMPYMFKPTKKITP
jgi:hypothetical protein